jgi:hypothetical protein
MNNLEKYEASETGRLHLLDKKGKPLYADGADGQPDVNKPIVAVLYGPASERHAAASAAQNKRVRATVFNRGTKVDQTPDEQRREDAGHLASITHSIENLSSDEVATTDRAKLVAVYENPRLGFITGQVDKFVSDWANF